MHTCYYIYICDISIDFIIRHTSISYVLYFYTHICTWLYGILPHLYPNNQPTQPDSWLLKPFRLGSKDLDLVHKFQKGSPKPPVFQNHRDCSLLPPLIYIRSLSFLIMHLQKKTSSSMTVFFAANPLLDLLTYPIPSRHFGIEDFNVSFPWVWWLPCDPSLQGIILSYQVSSCPASSSQFTWSSRPQVRIWGKPWDAPLWLISWDSS